MQVTPGEIGQALIFLAFQTKSGLCSCLERLWRLSWPRSSRSILVFFTDVLTRLETTARQRWKSCLPGVEEYQFQVQTGSEHEHVAVEFDLSDGTGRQRLAHGHQPNDLVAGVVQGHIQHVLADFQVATAVNHLEKKRKTHSKSDGKAPNLLPDQSQWAYKEIPPPSITLNSGSSVGCS